MGFLKALGRRATHLVRRGQFDRDLEQEMRFHLDSRVEELENNGMPRADAVAQARREFGSRVRVAEDSRDVWRFQWLEDLFTDMRHAVRGFVRKPAFALTAIGCLALGIAANTIIFSLVNTILLRSMPYPNADRLVMVRFTPPNQPDQKFGSNSGTYFFIRKNNHVFESMGGLRLTGFSVAPGTSEDESTREWILGGWASPGLTDTVGVAPELGRWFKGQDDMMNIVISHRLWQQMFGSASDVLGNHMVLDLGVATIIGVMPAGYQTLNPDIDFWHLQPDEDLARALRSPNRLFNLFARLKPGVTVEQAQADISSLTGPLSEEFEMNRGWNIKVESLRDAYVGHLRQPLLVFQGAVLLLLLIACANVAGLLLAQANARQKELSVRSALGSTRSRVMRQLLAESLSLALLAGVAGVAVGWVGLRLFARIAPMMLPGVEVTMDIAVVIFAFGLSLATGIVFGALPALQISRGELMGALRESSRSVTAGVFRQRLGSAFVVVQVALALVLLIGAGLLMNSLLRLNMIAPGFNPHGLLTFQVPFSRSLYRGAGNTPSGGLQVEVLPKFNVLAEQVRERLGEIPGIHSVTFGMTPPLGGLARRLAFKKDGQALNSAEEDAQSAEWYPIGPSYFKTLDIPILRGREFNTQDTGSSVPAIIINETLAKRFYGNDDPIGKRIQTSLVYDSPREIVGVVGNVRQDRYQYGPVPQMYVPHGQLPAKLDMSLTLDLLVATYVIRTSENPAPFISTFRKTVANVDRSQAVTGIVSVEQYAAGQLQDLRRYAILLSVFGGISAMLSFIGLFGVMAHTVSQRTNEIGIRVALGATARAVVGLVGRQGLGLVGAGMALGVAVSLALTRVLGRFLWGVSATDPITFIVVLLAMTAVALIACYVPARRALRIDPIIALRLE